MGIINTLAITTKEIYYLEHKLENRLLCSLWAQAGQSCACGLRQVSLVRVDAEARAP